MNKVWVVAADRELILTVQHLALLLGVVFCSLYQKAFARFEGEVQRGVCSGFQQLKVVKALLAITHLGRNRKDVTLLLHSIVFDCQR